MKAFVLRDDLLNESDTRPVRVVASYPNEQPLTLDQHGTQFTLLTVRDDAIVRTSAVEGPIIIMVLKAGWRDDYLTTVNAEAERRISDVFPDYKQRNATAQVQDFITQYGTATTSWPAAAQNFKVEADRGWTYVHDVRAAANSWTAMPVDPTADEIWPPIISPVVLPPT